MAVSTEESEVIRILAIIINDSLGIITRDSSNDRNFVDDIASNDHVASFVASYNINVLILSLSHRKDKAKLVISTNILEKLNPNSKCLFLIKHECTIINKENVNSILTVIASPNIGDVAKQFKNALKHLYIPYFNSTQNDIAQALGGIYGDIESAPAHSDDEDNLSKITTIDDEIRSVLSIFCVYCLCVICIHSKYAQILEIEATQNERR